MERAETKTERKAVPDATLRKVISIVIVKLGQEVHAKGRAIWRTAARVMRKLQEVSGAGNQNKVGRRQPLSSVFPEHW